MSGEEQAGFAPGPGLAGLGLRSVVHLAPGEGAAWQMSQPEDALDDKMPLRLAEPRAGAA